MALHCIIYAAAEPPILFLITIFIEKKKLWAAGFES
jgi:hypothetical protein